MSIPVRIIDNNSQIKVKVKGNDNIPVKSNCNVDKNRLEDLIKQERKERIAADEYLEAQIVDKQDKIKYIELFTPTGILDEEMLNLLISDRLNRIIYLDNYYMLSTKDNRYWRYMGQTTDPNILNTIVVDTSTREWTYSEIGNAELQNHIADNNRHLREGEREFWNNKLNCETAGELLEFNRH